MTETLAASPLARTVVDTATDIWNDSCAVDELEYAIANGAVGATANPTIVHDVWKADPARWRAATRDLAEEHPDWTEVDLAWGIVEAMSLRAAPLLLPAYERFGGRKGRLSMQTNPTLFRSVERMVAPYHAPGNTRSSAYFARPVSFAVPSRRRGPREVARPASVAPGGTISASGATVGRAAGGSVRVMPVSLLLERR